MTMEPIIPSFEALSSPIWVASLVEAESPASFVVDLAGIRGKRINALADVPLPAFGKLLVVRTCGRKGFLGFSDTAIRPLG